MNFRTQIPLTPQAYHQIDYTSKVLLLGSCFSEHIGDKVEYFKFQKLQNPFGILFQPLALEQMVTNAINQKVYVAHDVFFHNEQWHCFEAHSRLSHTSQSKLLEELNAKSAETRSFLKEASHIVVTLGTAWAYRFIETDTLVANCHKVPQKRFLKELLTVRDISESLEALMSLVRTINPKITFLFTVSPVRHLKDGFVENTQSKAHLIAAIHQIVEPRNNCYYFPSYEIMMDELRDYRFYKPDMVHPNDTSIAYIWERFCSVWMTQETHDIMHLVNEIQKGMAHKPFNPQSEAHQKFVKQLEAKQDSLKSKVPHMSF